MQRRDFMIALAVCAPCLSPVVRGLLSEEAHAEPIVVQQSPPPGERAPVGKPTPVGQPTPTAPKQPVSQKPQPKKTEPNEPEPRPGDDERPPVLPKTDPDPDACPACGMARIDPRGMSFLSTYTK